MDIRCNINKKNMDGFSNGSVLSNFIQYILNGDCIPFVLLVVKIKSNHNITILTLNKFIRYLQRVYYISYQAETYPC
jgi:hypothetical protein